jgi:hypothetical protein
MLKPGQLTRLDLMTRVAIARFGIIRARFNKRSTPAFPKADHHRSDRRKRRSPFEYRRSLLRLLGSIRFA